MVTLCIYYGEKEWDGPLSLVDMLDIPDKLKFIFSDYKFNYNIINLGIFVLALLFAIFVTKERSF